MKKAKKSISKPITIQIKDGEGKVKRIGKYYPSSHVFKAVRSKKEHFMVKYNAWALDSKVVDFLIKEHADVIIRDKDTRWEFKCFSGDFKVYGSKDEFDCHKSQYFLPIDRWEVIRASNRSNVFRCMEKSCAHNFGSNCLRGAIEINSDGMCANYLER